MNRQELSWALSAALPHAGKGSVGGIWLEAREGRLYVYATDSYTIGIATVPIQGRSEAIRAKISAKEAAELERWIRPQRVTDRDVAVTYVVAGSELHIGYGTSEDESTVFALEDPNQSHLDSLLAVIKRAKDARLEFAPVGIQPAFMARFTKAGDSVRIEFKRWGVQMGALLVEAPNFVGLAANLAYWATPASTDLQNCLAS